VGDGGNDTDSRSILVTEKNLWFLERSIPLFGMLEFFPPDCIGSGTSTDRQARKLTIETDQGWSFSTEIAADSKTFRNSSRNRGTGKWVLKSALQAGDRIVIQKIDSHTYKLRKEARSD